MDEQHSRSGTAIDKNHEETTSRSSVESVASNGEAGIRNMFGTAKIKLVFDKTQDCVVQVRDNLEDSVLWAPGLVEANRHAVFLNGSHDFYRKYYLPNKDNSTLIMAMDALLWSLAEAELNVLSNTVKKNLEELRVNVSRSLRTLSTELPEVKDNGYDNTEEEDI